MMGIGTAKCRQCGFCVDGDDLTFIGEHGYCPECVCLMAPVFLTGYAYDLKMRARNTTQKADQLLEILEAVT